MGKGKMWERGVSRIGKKWGGGGVASEESSRRD